MIIPETHMFLRYKVAILILLNLLLLGGCTDHSTPMNRPTPVVGVIAVTSTSVKPSREFVVRTKEAKSVNLLAQVSGTIIQRNFTEGTAVKKGQLLYKIDPIQYKIALDKAQAQLDSDEARFTESLRNLKRGEKLNKQKLISVETYDGLVSTYKQQMAALEASKAQIAQAKINLSYTDIIAPFDGVIGITNYHVGSLISSSDVTPLAEIVSVSPVYVSFQLNEQDYLHYLPAAKSVDTLKKQLDFTLKLSDGTVYPQKGTLNYISPKVSQDTDTITFRVSFPNPDNLLRPGMYATMKISDSKPLELRQVPQVAVQHGKNGAFVYLVNQGRVIEKPIEPGPQKGNLQTVVKGLKAGDKVIVQGFLTIQSGQQVNAKEVVLNKQGGFIVKKPAPSVKKKAE